MTDNCKRVHFIGVGGVGMSGIARVAADAGMRVSGSDMKSSRYTDDLVAAGIPIFIGHDAKHVTDDIDAVVISTAIPETNPELVRARELGIAVWHRAHMLAELGRGKKTLAAPMAKPPRLRCSPPRPTPWALSPRSSWAASWMRITPMPFRARAIITLSRPMRATVRS